MPTISVVIPVRNEEHNIPVLTTRLIANLEKMGLHFEIIYVTDLNSDRTFEVIKAEIADDSRVKCLKLSNSFGHHIAVMAGIEACGGSAVVLMDGDLQDYPEDIPLLYSKMMSGYDVVYALKEQKNEGRLRNLFSYIFNKIFAWLSDYTISANSCLFRIMTRKTVAELLKFKEYNPSLTYLMGYINFPTARIKACSGKRVAGKSKYGICRQLGFALTSLLSYSTKPLMLLSLLGIFFSILSIAYALVVLCQKIFSRIEITGWTTIIILMTLLGGLQLFGMGILGMYIGQIFLQSKGRPLYVVQEKVGRFDHDAH